MKCPRDRSVLVFTDEGRFPRNKCPACKGLLMGDDEVAAALGGKILAAERIAALPAGPVACPRDGTPMRRLEHQGVELDLCGECRALWLDAGELDKIDALRSKRRAAVGAAAAVAGGAAVAAAASQPAQAQSVGAQVLQGAGEVVAEGALDVAFELVGDVLGAVLEGFF